MTRCGLCTAATNAGWRRRVCWDNALDVPSDCAWMQKARARRLSRAHHDEPGVVIFASSRSVAIRFCNVRRLIPNIPAASLRLPRM